jgi:plasmid stabilization system protein ParE
MAKYKLKYTKDALDDLDSIFDYITKDNRQAALGMPDRWALKALSDGMDGVLFHLGTAAGLFRRRLR